MKGILTQEVNVCRESRKDVRQLFVGNGVTAFRSFRTPACMYAALNRMMIEATNARHSLGSTGRADREASSRLCYPTKLRWQDCCNSQSYWARRSTCRRSSSPL